MYYGNNSGIVIDMLLFHRTIQCKHWTLLNLFSHFVLTYIYILSITKHSHKLEPKGMVQLGAYIVW